jgi:hypothetical protein
MTTGYIVTGRGDLDTIFKARTSAAITDTGFRRGASTDLSQLFEPRAGTPQVANTGFVSGTHSADLAQLFMDINALFGDRTLGAVQSGTSVGYAASEYTATFYGSLSDRNLPTSRVGRLTTLNGTEVRMSLLADGAAPANDDTVWISVQIRGVFTDSAGATVIRSLNRTSAGTTGTGNVGGSLFERFWIFPIASANFLNGESYRLLFHVG